MNQFKFLTIDSFEYLLKTYEQLSTSIQNDITRIESNKAKLTPDETSLLKLYQHNQDILIESTFLQIYATLEEGLYNECVHHLIKKKASISRFETALGEQGYLLDNEHWRVLLDISKIRNCLLHGNGRLDADQYGLDTRMIINTINSGATLVEIIVLHHHKDSPSRIKLMAQFISYYIEQIKHFIDAQRY